MLSVPVERQFEQVLNALYLQELGYGTHARRLDEPTLGAFLARIPEHESALAGYRQDGNTVALATVKEQLGLVAARRAGGPAAGESIRRGGARERAPGAR